jgi:hypothetical protein
MGRFESRLASMTVRAIRQNIIEQGQETAAPTLAAGRDRHDLVAAVQGGLLRTYLPETAAILLAHPLAHTNIRMGAVSAGLIIN